MTEENKKKVPGQGERRITDAELSLIKNTFADNDDVLKAVRKVMLQMPLDAVDLAVLIPFKGNTELLALVRKMFLPTLDSKAPITQVVDLWMTLKVDDKSPEEAMPFIIARSQLIEYINQQLNELAEVGNERPVAKLDFNSFTPSDLTQDAQVIYANLLVRNTMISHTEQQLNQLRFLAGQKEETLEETKKRLTENSSK